MRTERTSVKGSVPAIVRNDAGLYEGNLVHYYRVLFNSARNLNNPYHNYRHIMHVVYLCHDACEYYVRELTPRQRRNLLISALFHDFDHTGKFGPDSMNISIALRAVNNFLAPEDRPYQPDIERLVALTEFPYRVPAEELDLAALILRDADMGQALSIAWIQQVIFGLAEEWGKTLLEVIKMQAPFHAKMKFHTGWAKKMFPPEVVQAKINEAEELLDLAEEPAVATT